MKSCKSVVVLIRKWSFLHNQNNVSECSRRSGADNQKHSPIVDSSSSAL